MKYEMIFGDEGVFDGAPEYATHATKGGGFYFIDTGVVKFISNIGFGAMDVCELTGYLVAERRIIKEPKRWTWEDKRGGLLPEVGCDIQYIDSQKRVSVIAINSNEIVLLAKSNGSKFFVLDPDSLLNYYNPSETLAEKAQREEDEFVNFVLHRSESKINSSEELVAAKRAIKLAYKLQLSGELADPKVGE